METKSNLIAILILVILIWFILWLILRVFKFIKRKLFPEETSNQKKPISSATTNVPVNSSLKPPTILSNLAQPGFPGKIFTLFFMNEGLVFSKTGIGSANISGTWRTFWGGAGFNATLASGIGGLFDHFLSRRRSSKAAEVAVLDSKGIVSANKHNFMLRYENVTQIKIKKPDWFGEMKIIFIADKEYKFRVHTNSDYLFNYYKKTLTEFLPGKVVLI
jgi:hypothetical protein